MSEHYIENKVYYHDTDSGGIVYYARYLEHLEEARAEFLLSRGISTDEYAKKGILFPVVHVEADYKSPARYADRIRIYTKVEKVGNASIQFSQEIKRGTELLVSAKTIWACVGPTLKPMRVPDDIRQKLQQN
jgi:acyl-CoA thioester hydrolase